MHDDKRMLEAGNVLSYYYRVRDDIIGRRNESERVINLEIIGFYTTKRYDLVINISTIEHIGFMRTSTCEKRLVTTPKTTAGNRAFACSKTGTFVTIPSGYPLWSTSYFERILKMSLPVTIETGF